MAALPDHRHEEQRRGWKTSASSHWGPGKAGGQVDKGGGSRTLLGTADPRTPLCRTPHSCTLRRDAHHHPHWERHPLDSPLPPIIGPETHWIPRSSAAGCPSRWAAAPGWTASGGSAPPALPAAAGTGSSPRPPAGPDIVSQMPAPGSQLEDRAPESDRIVSPAGHRHGRKGTPIWPQSQEKRRDKTGWI